MPDDTKIYIELSDEIQQILSENSISISDILAQKNIDAEVEYGIMPSSSNEGSRTRDLATIILAGSAAVLSISLAISQILSALHEKPHFVEYWAEEEIRDGDGKLILDKQGNPQTKMVKKHEIIEPSKKDKVTSLDIQAGNIALKFSFNEKAINTGKSK